MSQKALIPRIYALLFLTIEPLTALAGAYYAYIHPHSYLNLTYPDAPFRFLPDRLPPSVAIVLQQLANLYLFFAFNELVVLRAAAQKHPTATTFEHCLGMESRVVDIWVWRAVLTCLLIADVGHLWSVRSLGASYFYDVAGWNKMAWGNVGVVYAGMMARVCFLSGLGIRGVEGAANDRKAKKRQ